MKDLRLVNGVVQRARALFLRISEGSHQLEQIQELDRSLVKLTHIRERLLGQLAHRFLTSEISQDPLMEFRWVIQEIRHLEHERQQKTIETSSSLSSLIVPNATDSADLKTDRLALITAEERSEIYRRRLRGLYLDLAEMLLSHHLIESFPKAHERICLAQQELDHVRSRRDTAHARLPTSAGVLSSIKKTSLLLLVILITWIWI